MVPSIRPHSLVLAAVLAAAVAAGCANGPSRPDDLDGAIATTNAAYRAYERGDCDQVQASARQTRLVSWPVSEVRESFALVRAFCLELEGQKSAAQDAYRTIVRELPLSFASDDARERLRIMRLERNDPDYAAWVAAARERALEGSSDRAPVERGPAIFPPLAASAGIDGYAVVEFGVAPNGATDAPVIVASDPPLVFDGAALRAVRAWRYEQDTRAAASQRQAIKLVFQPDSRDVEAPDRDALRAPTSVE